MKTSFRRVNIPVVNVFDKQAIKAFVYEWNTKFPIDRWWRMKHGVPFNSEIHRSVSLMDIRFEFEEDFLFLPDLNKREYKPDLGDFMIENPKVEITEEDARVQYLKEAALFDLNSYDDGIR